MADRTFLEWPFFDDSHRKLADELERWCAAELGDEAADGRRRRLPRPRARLGAGGWLRYCVPAAHGGVHETLDVRSLALIRETLARHDGLADFAFAMQGLGSGTISLFGSDDAEAALSARRRLGRDDRRLRAQRARCRLRRRRPRDDLLAGPRRLQRRRHQDLHLERRHRRFLCRLRAHRGRLGGLEGHFRLHRRCADARASTPASGSR